MVDTVISADGTRIAYERSGAGPAVVVVGGALSPRGSGGPLAELLADRLTVYRYDRRGRGDSTDTAPYAVEREIEDLQAVINAAGGSAGVYGHSSGAVLALEAAARGLAITRLVAYEPPYTGDPTHPVHNDAVDRAAAAVAAGDRELAVRIFLANTGMDDTTIEGIVQAPFWSGMVEMGDTTVYDLTIVGDGIVPSERFSTIIVPTLVMDGGASPEWARRASSAVAAAISTARELTLEGQTHSVDQAVLAPVLAEFFGER